ncbi:MAG: HNH endonuclease signature motif containing protein [Bryobacteraceae bacterium]
MNNDNELIKGLEATRKWSRQSALLGKRARFCCEYCGLDFLVSVENYKLWQVDHIVPTCSGGDPTDFDNLAVACKVCNWDWKNRWDPRSAAGENASREALIQAVREHIRFRKSRTDEELALVRRIVGYDP